MGAICIWVETFMKYHRSHEKVFWSICIVLGYAVLYCRCYGSSRHITVYMYMLFLMNLGYYAGTQRCLYVGLSCLYSPQSQRIASSRVAKKEKKFKDFKLNSFTTSVKIWWQLLAAHNRLTQKSCPWKSLKPRVSKKSVFQMSHPNLARRRF